MDVCLIQVPYMAGDDRHASSEGPQRLVEAGAVELLAAQALAVHVHRVERAGLFRDTAVAAADVNRRVATIVRSATETGQVPVVLAGSCNAALGVVAGFEHAGCGVVWIDAHADFNTPESTFSGFFPGMSVAVLAGHCYRDYWAQIGDSTPIAEDAVVMYGIRDLSPDAERRRLERSAIAVVPWRDGRAQRDLVVPLERLRGRTDELYVHVDFDAFAPDVAPGTVDEPVPGGLTLGDAETILREARERFRLRAATLATYTPELDQDDRTLRVGLRLIELFGEWARVG